MSNRHGMRFLALAFLMALLAAGPVLAQEAKESLSLNLIAGYCPPNLDGYQSSGFTPIDYGVIEGGANERDLGSSWGGAVALATLTYSRVTPALVGEGPFFSGNSLELDGVLELSPVTLEAKAAAVLTPVAFCRLEAGMAAGTGWSLGFVGLAINPTDSAVPVEEIPFGGAVLKAWAAGTLQFDLAAVLPGDWNHVVALATGKFEYRNNTAADPTDAWVWQADEGMNFNGWRYLGTYVLGYQMPLKVNMVGVMLETEEYLGAVRNYGRMSNSWGSDFVLMRISPLVNIAFDERNSLTVVAQIKSTQDWTDGTTQRRSFQQRIYEGRQFYLDRVAFSYTLVLR